jgi:3',5'-nucleoside bisphosphate phosphatase
MENRADLHLHTTASDGVLSPAEVVEIASRIGLAAVAITDHDTVAGIDEALEAGERCGVEVVPGVEISTIYDGGHEAHILGYYMDHRDPGLVESLHILKNARWERGRQMVERLNAAGIDLDFQRVTELAKGGAIGRPHVARALCEAGVVSSMDSAFGRFLQEGGPAFVPRYKVSPEEAVRMIVDAGGAAGCAHVAKLKTDQLLVDLMALGLTAIEVYHPDHSSAICRFYKRFAERHGLVVTGGSDAHYFDAESKRGIGEITVPGEVVVLLARAAAGPQE